jgi:site-specific DNA-methyltransferase (adenine-specific)
MQQHVASGSVDLVFTDPPYGIRGDQLDTHYNRDDTKVIPGYVDVPNDQYAEWCRTWIQECERVLRPGGSMYIVSGYSNLHHILNALHETSLEEINHIIAQYTFGVYTKKKWVSSHYHVLFWAKPETRKQPRTFNTHCRFADTTDSYNDRLSVQRLPREYKTGEVRNNNQLAESFIEKFIEYSSNPGDLVLDPFGGSFSTGRAAAALGRRFIGFELNPYAYQHFGQISD